MDRFKYKNPMQVPGLKKVVDKHGAGRSDSESEDPGKRPSRRWQSLSGQWPVMRKARKSIATFKLREGMTIGCKVTLRRDNMYHFLDKLINVALAAGA